jgi:hypothetical protein
MTRPKSDEGVGRLIVASKDMMKLKTVELLLEFSYFLAVCHHVGLTKVRLLHDLVDDEPRVTADVESLDPKLSSDGHDVDEGLIFRYIVCCVEM